MTRSLNTSMGTMVQSGPQLSASSSTCVTPSRRANTRANVVLPEPVDPTTEMRFSEAQWLSGGLFRLRVRVARLHLHELVVAQRAVSPSRRLEDFFDTLSDLLGLLV